MKNILLICKKELKSYFASPIAYLLMAFFGLIFGFGFFTATRDFVRFSFQAQMMGQQQPMNVNDQIIRPLLGFASTIALFLIPMITMRLFAEEKRTGTIELLMTSPIKDIEIIIGKWLGAVLLYHLRARHVDDQRRHALRLGQARSQTRAGRLPRPDPARRHACWPSGPSSPPPPATRSSPAASPSLSACCSGCSAGSPPSIPARASQVVNYISIVTHFENFSKGVLDSKDVVFYLSMIFFSLFITSRAMESLRWRA